MQCYLHLFKIFIFEFLGFDGLLWALLSAALLIAFNNSSLLIIRCYIQWNYNSINNRCLSPKPSYRARIHKSYTIHSTISSAGIWHFFVFLRSFSCCWALTSSFSIGRNPSRAEENKKNTGKWNKHNSFNSNYSNFSIRANCFLAHFSLKQLNEFRRECMLQRSKLWRCICLSQVKSPQISNNLF